MIFKSFVKRAAAAALSLAAALLLCASAGAAGPEVSAEACVLMDAESGTVIYEKNADEKMLIASTTKIMTALVALEHCGLDETVEIKREWALTEGSSMGLVPGESCSVRELLYGLLLASGNDAGVALACHAAGSVAAFAEMMNAKAAELGMEGSHFSNPHGLDDPEHYSTARDMAILAAAAMENPELALIASTKEIRLSESRYFSNHNKLLWQCEGCEGLKTGYTSKAGRTLVSACKRNGTRLICVTLRDGNDWADHAALYDWGFENYETVTAVEPGKTLFTLPVISGESGSVGIQAAAQVRVFVKKGNEVSLRESLPRFAWAEVRRGDTAGLLRIYVNGQPVAETPLVYAETVGVDESVPLGFWERIRWAWYLANEYAPQSGAPLQ